MISVALGEAQYSRSFEKVMSWHAAEPGSS
jgi:hypothetical protein